MMNMELSLMLSMDYLCPESMSKMMLVSKYCNELVNEHFDRIYPKPTSHVFRGKDSLPTDIVLTFHNRISFLLKKCAICKKKYKGSFSRFGVYGHLDCIHPFLMNTYYLSDYGLLEEDIIQKIPYDVMLGFRYYYKTQFDYNVIWKYQNPHLINNSYTFEHLLENDKDVSLYVERYQQRKEKERRDQEEREEMLKRYRENLHERRIEKLQERIEAFEKSKQKYDVPKLLFWAGYDENFLYGDYFQSSLASPKTKLLHINRILKFFNKIDALNIDRTPMHSFFAKAFVSAKCYDEEEFASVVEYWGYVRNQNIFSKAYLWVSSPLKFKQIIENMIGFEQSFSDYEINTINYMFPNDIHLNKINCYKEIFELDDTTLNVITQRNVFDKLIPFIMGRCTLKCVITNIENTSTCSSTCNNLGSKYCSLRMCSKCCTDKDCKKHYY